MSARAFLQRAVKLAVTHLVWRLQHEALSSTAHQRRSALLVHSPASFTICGLSTAPTANQLALDVYTEGSFDRSTSTSSWAVVIGDD
jgi:hypothetical protein